MGGQGDCADRVRRTLRRCSCEPVPDDYALRVLDDDGNEVRDGECVPGGRAEVIALDFEGGVEWRLDGDAATAEEDRPRRLRVSLEDESEHTVEATVGRGDCAETSRRTIRRCAEENGPPGESLTCAISRWVFVLLASLSLLALVVLLCVTQLGPGAQWLVLGIAIGFAVAAAIVLAIWLTICPEERPCEWLLLFTWQVSIGVGLSALLLANCCPGLWVLGGGLAFAGLLLMWWWAVLCKASFCEVLTELAPVIGTVLSAVGVVSLVPVVNAMRE